MSTSRVWFLFRRARVVIFAISAIIALVLSILFIFLLVREWKEYNLQQHIAVTTISALHIFCAIFLYLMIVVQFRLWLDAARTLLVIVVETGGAVVFAIMNSAFPCREIGSPTDCRLFLSSLQNAGWVLPGILVFYTFVLAVMHHVPTPPPKVDPEATLTDKPFSLSRTPSFSSDTKLLKPSKRYSVGSAQTHDSFIQPYTPSIMSLREHDSILALSTARWDIGTYRTNTPASMASYPSRSQSVGSGIDMRQHLNITQSGVSQMQQLPNPFADPVARQRSPLSMEDNLSVLTSGTGATLSPSPAGQGLLVPSPPRPLLLLSPQSARSPLPPPSLVPGGSPNSSPSMRTHEMRPGTPISLLPAAMIAPPARQSSRQTNVRPISPMAASIHSGRSQNNASPLLLSAAPVQMPGLFLTPRLATSPPPYIRENETQ